MSLPYAVDAETPLTPEELAVLRNQYDLEGEAATVQTRFNYAWGLVKSRNRADVSLGLHMFSEIFRGAESRRRECLYYMALGHYKLGNYEEARHLNQRLLDNEPGNNQAGDLRTLIDDRVRREGIVGMAIVSGAVVVAGVVGGFFLRNMRRR